MQYEDILGQKEIKKQLQQTIAENRVSHAQLFLGPEGSGALPMALAYATEILCTNTNKNKRASFLKCQKLAHPDLHLVFPTNTTTLVKKNAIYKAFQAEFREAVFENPYLSLNQWLDIALRAAPLPGTPFMPPSPRQIHSKAEIRSLITIIAKGASAATS
mgnify:CR=1 FL=1